MDALGINCGMGPEQMMPILHEILEYTSLPVIVKPNAGLPKQRDGETYYDVEPEQFCKDDGNDRRNRSLCDRRMLWYDTGSHPGNDRTV